MHPQQRIFANITKAQITELVRDLDRSMETDAAEVSLYQILGQKLTDIRLTTPGDEKAPMAVDFALREKDEVTKTVHGMVQKKYDEINGKQQAIAFLMRIAPYAT